MRVPAGIFLTLAWLAGSAPAGAQTTARVDDTFVDDCRVLVRLASPRAGDFIEVAVSGARYPEQQVPSAAAQTLEFTVLPLRPGDDVRLRRNGSDLGAPVMVAAAPGGRAPAGTCPLAPAAAEEREANFEASAYLGTAVDTFAPDAVGQYRNPGAGSGQKTRWIFGVNFDYRLIGNDASQVQVWLAGETLHGLRTADIDCVERPAPVCDEGIDSDFAGRAKYILQHADSLEAFISPRVEFLDLPGVGTAESPVRLYWTGRLGFMALDKAPTVFRAFHSGLGLAVKGGPFLGTALEVGMGNNELFAGGREWNRLKIDGFLTFGLERLVRTDAVRFFIQMYVDNDLNNDPRTGAPDSIQTFYGLDIDVRRFFGGN